MTARFQTFPAALRSGSHQIAAAVAIVFAGALSTPGAAFAQTAAATGAASAVATAGAPSGADAGATQFTVQPGQSLNDAAIALTQSHDRAVLARAAKAIFDANPNAFMGHDPSRLRLGAVLSLPPVDATGAAASAAAAAGPASAPGSTAQAASNASATTSAAGAQPSAAPADTGASASAGPAASSAAAAPSLQGASAPATTEPTSAAGSQAPGAAAPSAAPASGTHAWTGSIQSSAPAAGALPASQAHPQVSSLQQLLALKNRVLMELQKHGIGKQPASNGNAATAPGATQPSGSTAGASAPANATPASPTAAPAKTHPANGPAGIPQEYLGVAAVVGAALVALLAGLTMRRRSKAAREEAAANEASASTDETPRVAPDAARVLDETPRIVPDAARVRDETPAAPKAPSPSPADTHPAAHAAPTAPVAESEARAGPETFDAASAEAGLAAAASLGADALPRESLDPAREQARTADAAAQEQVAREQVAQTIDHAAETTRVEPSLDEAPIHAPIEPAAHQALEASEEAPETTSAPLKLDLGAAPDTAFHEPIFEPPASPATPPIQLGHVEPAAQHEQLIEPLPDDDSLALPDQPSTPERFPLGEPPPLGPAIADEFPRDAIRALDSLDDFALPPRAEHAEPTADFDLPDTLGAHPATPPASLTTQPVVTPDITARQAMPEHAPEPPAAADEIVAGTAGAAAVAGLGAAPFGALNLDFDLELPPGPSQAVPAFTPEELARIARNKLDLAVEYIDLGDVVGARTLINEVIESNDAATRADARALLSTLAPLS
ncbi:FimV/HubP family polar landmark protein [Paraburkholderia diazotrophica]|uniref:FimV C-terminal domain-containing protein n=1 Tax=Paraburkholderia diazotrophica TaxID=667676 RepID=A0A1H7DHE9_9BURK|nr:FimV/HubP family polar landmark protein [Paraburkholderia diazotrophica]SEJ99012.1 FimV C-terminal domain-containing protein [Paraburkholderia diazotrophica]